MGDTLADTDGLDPIAVLGRLIRFDTTNPPGNERACIEYIADLLRGAGIEPGLAGRSPERPNLVARIRGGGGAAPLMFNGHVDVVGVAGQGWTVPPFEGIVKDGFIWGRGAIDMKGAVASMVSAFLRLAASGKPPSGDVVLCLVADEEAGGADGARFLVEERPDLLAGVRYAITEGMGFNIAAGGKRLYPLQLAEKQVCRIRVTARGPGGHGAAPVEGGALASLGRALERLDGTPLPVHVVPLVKRMMDTMADLMPFPAGPMIRLASRPRLTDLVLESMGGRRRIFAPLFRNTASPTILEGSRKVNVIPEEASVILDGRVLPGFTPGDLVAEIKALLGPAYGVAIEEEGPALEPGEGSLAPALGRALCAIDPDGVLWPFLLGGTTDARHFARLGIETYGFMPTGASELGRKLPADLVHGADERIPLDMVTSGAEAFYQIMIQDWRD